MSAPFYKFGYFNDEFSLIVALLIGIAFGVVLERAGFGSGRKLAAQFYFTDMTVLKVMFTAIVTAMLGIYYLSVLGFMDLSLVFVNPTFLLPQIAGGLILGVGFVIGGYCPGTSCVSAATGRIDGVVFLAGVLGGILAFGESFPLVQGFYGSTAMGEVTLPRLLGVPYGVVVFAVVLMALGAFAAAEWGERKTAARKGA